MGRADEVERIAALLEPWENLAPQYQAAQMLREYAQILRDTRPAVEQAINEVLEQRVAERCAPLVAALEQLRVRLTDIRLSADNFQYLDAVAVACQRIIKAALRAHRERTGE